MKMKMKIAEEGHRVLHLDVTLFASACRAAPSPHARMARVTSKGRYERDTRNCAAPTDTVCDEACMAVVPAAHGGNLSAPDSALLPDPDSSN